MNEAEKTMVALASDALDKQGPSARVQVVIPRVPSDARYCTNIRLRPKAGPYGVIKSLRPDGTVAEFEAAKIVAFFCNVQDPTPVRASSPVPAGERVKIHPNVSRSLIDRLNEHAAKLGLSQSALVDMALHEFLQRA